MLIKDASHSGNKSTCLRFILNLLEYYLEDAIQMLGFVPPLNTKKNNKNDDTEEEVK